MSQTNSCDGQRISISSLNILKTTQSEQFVPGILLSDTSFINSFCRVNADGGTHSFHPVISVPSIILQISSNRTYCLLLFVSLHPLVSCLYVLAFGLCNIQRQQIHQPCAKEGKKPPSRLHQYTRPSSSSPRGEAAGDMAHEQSSAREQIFNSTDWHFLSLTDS